MLWPHTKADGSFSRWSAVRTRWLGFSSRLLERALRINWREDRRLVDVALDKEAGNEVGNRVASVRGHG